jgi:hypothetical protein
MPLDLPGHEHTVSATALEGDNLFVRFIADYHLGTDAAAFELLAAKIEDASAVVAYLDRAREANEYLYVFERGQSVVLSDESGDEIELRAESIRSKFDRPNAEELGRFLIRAREAYEQEYKASSAALARLRAVQELVGEQVRRLEVKSASHEQGSTAAVLYGQQIQFLQRVYGATEA